MAIRQLIHHSSCRDGLREAPVAPRKRAISTNEQTTTPAATASDPSPKSFSHVIEPRSKKKQQKVAPKVDKTMERLDALHQSTDVRKRLGIKDDHRLKLADFSSSLSKSSSRKPKIVPNFDLTFTDGNEGPIPSDPYFEGDGDDLPNIGQLLESALSESAKRSDKLPSPNSNYSNSEMDALIRDTPLDVLQAATSNVSVDPYKRSVKRAREIEAENPASQLNYQTTQGTPSPQPKVRRRAKRS